MKSAQQSDTVLDKTVNTVDSASIGDNPSNISEESGTANNPETLESANNTEVSDSVNGRQSEPHPGFVYVRGYVSDVIEDILYSTTNNFMGELSMVTIQYGNQSYH